MDELKAVHEAELKILKEIDRICKKHGLSYMLDSGTLLGAVRHGGFIPWDDDADVALLRADYEKFIKEAPRELPAGMELILPESFTKNDAFYDFTARIIYKNSRCHEDSPEMDFYEGKLNHIWVDLFILDDLPAGTLNKKVTLLLHTALYGLAMGHRYHIDFGKYGKVTAAAIRALAAVGKCLPLRWIFAWQRKIALKDHTRYPKEYYYSNYQPDYLSVTLEASWCDEKTYLGFEDTELLAPAKWDDVLTHIYGDYNTLPPSEKQVPSHSSVKIRVDEACGEDEVKAGA